ncbi:MAG: xylulose kinase [Caldilineaceae bacterium]|nr:xylulose kinase [Caldilineaceae bacterium]
MSAPVSFEPPYFLGIDAGTEAIKAGIFDARGQRVALAACRYPTYFPRPGWAEQDPDQWWSSLVTAIRECVAAAPIDAREIKGISADATSCTLIPMGADGRHLRNCLLWMDVRAAAQADAVFASGHPALRYCLGGVNAEWMPPKMLWLKQNEPDTYASMDVLLEYTDWIAYRLTGRYTLNISTSSHRWFYHTPSGGWSNDFFETIGLPDLTSRFPADVLGIGEVVGPLREDVAAELGLPAGIPVSAGGADAFIGMFGQGVTKPGDMGVIMGSSNVMSALAAEEFHFPGIFGGFPDSLIPGLCMVEAGQVSTGSILTWFRRNFARGADAEAAAQNISVYELLDGEAGAVPVGSNGLIVLDYFQGNRTPHTDSFARGAVWGLSLQTGRGEVYRALMEGIAYGMADILATFAANDFQVERIIASGGATLSSLFMQIYTDVAGKAITTTAETEASALGSAIVAAVGAGHFPDLAAASQAMVTIDRTYEPDAGRHAEYAYYLQKYQETYRQLRPLMLEMAEQQR